MQRYGTFEGYDFDIVNIISVNIADNWQNLAKDMVLALVESKSKWSSQTSQTHITLI
jgi:hypothetical protein